MYLIANMLVGGMLLAVVLLVVIDHYLAWRDGKDSRLREDTNED